MAKIKLRNWMPAMILRSPLHGLISGKVVIVTFTGRRTGRVYATPVSYHRDGGSVIVATDSSWWRNFVDAAPARLRLRGHDVPAVGEALTDPDEAVEALATLIRGVPSYGRWAHVRMRDGEPEMNDVRAAVASGRVPVRLRLQDPAEE